MNAWSWKLSEDQNEDSLIKIFSILFESCSTFSVIQYPTLFTTVPRATTTSHSPLNFLPPCCMPIHFFSLNFSLSLSLSPSLPSRSDKFKLRFSTFSGVEKTGDKFFIEMEEISRRRRWMKPRFFLTFSNV